MNRVQEGHWRELVQRLRRSHRLIQSEREQCKYGFGLNHERRQFLSAEREVQLLATALLDAASDIRGETALTDELPGTNPLWLKGTTRALFDPTLNQLDVRSLRYA